MNDVPLLRNGRRAKAALTGDHAMKSAALQDMETFVSPNWWSRLIVGWLLLVLRPPVRDFSLLFSLTRDRHTCILVAHHSAGSVLPQRFCEFR